MGGGGLEKRGAYLRGGAYLLYDNLLIFLQPKEMCVNQLCILTILTQDVETFNYIFFNYSTIYIYMS